MMRDITLQLPEKEPITVAFGRKAYSVIAEHFPEHLEAKSYEDNPVVGVLLNNLLLSLSAPLEVSGSLEPVRLFSGYGKRIYRHSICFLLAAASARVFKDRRLVIGHSLGDGYFYTFDDDLPVTPADAAAIEDQMREYIKQDERISNVLLSYQNTLKFFEQKHISDTALLLSYQNDPVVSLYECDGFLDLAYEPLVPRCGLLERFALMSYRESGLLLRYPRTNDFLSIGSFSDNPVLFEIYQEHKRWGRSVDVTCLGELNRLCDTRRIDDFIQISESFQNKRISKIADMIGAKPQLKCVLIAGPSSSGKTTFTKKLATQLRVLGYHPIEISLDNYYLPPSRAPKDEEGKPDLEALEALDVQKINEDLLDLLAGKEVDMIKYDFKTHTRTLSGKSLKLGKTSILIMEGIHGLNPRLTERIPDQAKFLIYISALTQLNLDDHNRISTTDNRIIRRIVRDHQFRGMSALRTLEMWPSVHRGEKRYIFPFQNNADVAFNSALDYELAVLKIYAQPLLKSVKPTDGAYTEAQRLLQFLENFYPIPPDKIPERSILREFIGGSGFSYS